MDYQFKKGESSPGRIKPGKIPMNRRRITDIFQIDSSVSLWSEVTEILRLISSSFPTDSIRPVFNSVNDLYHGNFPGYSACNTGYHDFRHATATFLAMTRLLHGAALDNCEFSASNVVAGLAAAILHDVWRSFYYRVAIKRHKKYLAGILSGKDSDPHHHLRRGAIVATVRRQYGSQDCSN